MPTSPREPDGVKKMKSQKLGSKWSKLEYEYANRRELKSRSCGERL